MKNICGFWLPDDEQHLIPFLEKGPNIHGGPTYQFHKLEPALKLTPSRGLAIDIGAHCGLWSRILQYEFAQVVAFEPVEAHRQCFLKNVTHDNVDLLPFALGDQTKDGVSLNTGASSSGDTGIVPNGALGMHTANMRKLDHFELHGVDFIKIDCEGYEHFIVRGAERTIRKWKPTVIVEQKPGHAEKYGLRRMQAVDLLESWGAKLRFEKSGDYCLTW